MRDTQRSKVYKSEDQAFKGLYGEEFSFDELGLYLECVKNSNYYRSQKGFKTLSLKRTYGRKGACYKPRFKTVEFSKNTRTRFIVCHEVAHSLAHKTVGNAAGHHASFCTHYANLVSEMICPAQAAWLIKAFDKNKVLYQKSNLIFDINADPAPVPMPKLKPKPKPTKKKRKLLTKAYLKKYLKGFGIEYFELYRNYDHFVFECTAPENHCFDEGMHWVEDEFYTNTMDEAIRQLIKSGRNFKIEKCSEYSACCAWQFDKCEYWYNED